MYVDTGGRDMVPFLEGWTGCRSEASRCGSFMRRSRERTGGMISTAIQIWTAMERMLCPRVHFKCIIVDGVKAYFGSANLTGAGMGAKSEKKRNFENGVLTDDPALVEPLVEQFDSVWRGAFCRECGRRDFCGDPVA